MPIEQHYEAAMYIKSILESHATDESFDLPKYNEILSTITKDFIICIASHHEKSICDIIGDTARQNVNNPYIVNFLEKKAIARQYHTFFSWKEPPRAFANQLFGLFGQHFLGKAKEKIRADNDFCTSLECFHYIGKTRNDLVHNNYISQSVDSTLEDLFYKYSESKKFLTFFKELLLDHAEATIE